MKSNWFLLIAVLCSASATADEIIAYTDLDFALLRANHNARIYMEEHGVSADKMFALMEENIAEHIANAAIDPVRYSAIGTTLHSLPSVDRDEGLRKLAGYAGKEFPKEIRKSAIFSYLEKTWLEGLDFAEKVIVDSWRSSDEHNIIRMEYYAQAMSSPPANREKYAEFFKWGGTNAPLGGG